MKNKEKKKCRDKQKRQDFQDKWSMQYIFVKKMMGERDRSQNKKDYKRMKYGDIYV